MTVKQWIRRLKSVRSRARKTSPQTKQVAAVSLVVMLSVAGIVIVANQASSSASAAPPVTHLAAAAPAPGRKATLTKAKPASATSTSAAPANSASANAVTSSVQTSDAVTIAGCLEQSHDTFRLKDAEGVDAPTSRNWKTVFLTKHAASIIVIDNGNQLKLGSHVGERVSLTGTLTDKEMQGRSLKTLDVTCN